MNYLRNPRRSQRRSLRLRTALQWLEVAAFPITLTFLLTMSSFLQDATIGEIAIGCYAVVALLLRLPSSTSFRMGIICLLFVPGISLLSEETDLAGTFAVYAFLLLLVGTVAALVEQCVPASWRLLRKPPIPNLQKSLEKQK